MKKGILRTLGVFVSLALMLAAFPASVAMAAAPTITIENIEGTSTTNPYYGEATGKIGDAIRISGSGTASSELHICISPQEADINDDIDDEITTYEWLGDPTIGSVTSTYSFTVDVPDRLTDGSDDISAGDMYGGVYYIYVCVGGTTNIEAKTTFYVAGVAEGTIDETAGPVGTQVGIECTGFAPEEGIEVYFEGKDITDDYVIDGDLETDNDGELQLVVEIPTEEYGERDLVVKGLISKAEVAFVFEVQPSITLTPSSGAAGSTILVQGTGFDGRNHVDISINSTFIIKSGYTDSTGSFSQQITIPASLSTGTYTISAEDEDDDDIYATANFTIALNSVLTLSNSSGHVGDSVTVTGTNFSPSTTLSILFDNTAVGTATTDAGGNFTSQVSIPAAVCGAHTIKIGSFGQTYTITPKITLDKTQGIAGTTVTITGTGFAASTAITATFNNSAVALSSSITNTTGGFVVTFTVPTAATGSYNVQVTAGSLASAGFSIVDASLSLGASSGHVGDAVTVTGTNFAAGSSVSITFDGTVVATPTADASGGFTATFNVPTAAGGTHTVVASSGAISKSTTFTVTANVSVTPATGNVGTQVTLSGTGFNANANVTITYNGSALQSGTAMTTNAAGALTVSFQVPASPSGARTVAVSDGVNSASATFVMEATAPAAPTLTSPVNASQEKGIVTFDWSDVTDVSSPVTYRLQVASDSGFSTVVVNVAGLTESTYTLTDAEKLVKLADGGSYYWRVIASDAASNTSASSVNTFTVGGSMPSWLMWVWIGIGIVVVFIFAIWLGRRLAYSSY